MAVITFEQWPESLRSADIQFHLNPHVKFGPALSDGRQQRVQSSAGHWTAEMTFDVSLLDEVREYLAVSTKAAGGVTEFFVPSRLRLLAPWPTGTTAATATGAVSIASGRSFSGGRRLIRKVINISVYAAAAAGATTMQVKILKAGTLKRG